MATYLERQRYPETIDRYETRFGEQSLEWLRTWLLRVLGVPDSMGTAGGAYVLQRMRSGFGGGAGVLSSLWFGKRDGDADGAAAKPVWGRFP
jgi:hypothetical protein